MLKTNLSDKTLLVIVKPSIYVLILLCFACEGPTDTCSNLPLDVVIDEALRQMSPRQQPQIIVNDMLGWDSLHSIVVITFPEKRLTSLVGEFNTGSYRGFPVYLIHGRLKLLVDVATMDEGNSTVQSMATSIIWSKKHLNLNPDLDMPPYSPPEIQLTYDPKRRCIQEILLTRWIEPEGILQSCHRCTAAE